MVLVSASRTWMVGSAVEVGAGLCEAGCCGAVAVYRGGRDGH